VDGGCLTCPWHGSTFRLADGSVARGPATAPQPAFEVREAGGAIQVMLPGAG
jgi:nitrite reductase/ring-hydroxylating ferredoxin subunit